MNESTMTGVSTTHAAPRASLAAIGALLRHRDVFGPVRERVTIAQKSVKYTPTDKLYDGLIAMLAGAHAMVEHTLDLDRAKRAQTIVRVDAGGGSLDDLNWLLRRSYQVMAKDYSSTRAARLAAISVSRLGRWTSARLRPRAAKLSRQMTPCSSSSMPLRIVAWGEPSWCSARRCPPGPNSRTVRAINSRRALPLSVLAVSMNSDLSEFVRSICVPPGRVQLHHDTRPGMV